MAAAKKHMQVCSMHAPWHTSSPLFNEVIHRQCNAWTQGARRHPLLKACGILKPQLKQAPISHASAQQASEPPVLCRRHASGACTSCMVQMLRISEPLLALAPAWPSGLSSV